MGGCSRRKRTARQPPCRGRAIQETRRPSETARWKLVLVERAEGIKEPPAGVLSVAAPRRAPGGPPGDMKPPGSPTLRAAQRWRVTKVPRASPLPDHPDEAEGLASAQ
jgi:hypothetical protein